MSEIKVHDVRCLKGDSAFLLDDGSSAVLYDTGFGFTGDAVAENIQALLGERKLDYIFLTHSHYDHVMGSPYVLRRYPEAKVVAGRYAAEIFRRDGAKRVMRELDNKFAARCGVTGYEFLGEELRVDIPVDDGDIIRVGDIQFEVVALPGHTRCSVGYFCRENKLLLSSETLGVYDGGDVITPSFLVGHKMTMESINRVLQMDIKSILAPHYGLLNDMQTRFFLDNMHAASENAAKWMLASLKSGWSEQEIIAEFKRRYRKGSVKESYPEDAVNLNTSIMIKLIREELLNGA